MHEFIHDTNTKLFLMRQVIFYLALCGALCCLVVRLWIFLFDAVFKGKCYAILTFIWFYRYLLHAHDLADPQSLTNGRETKASFRRANYHKTLNWNGAMKDISYWITKKWTRKIPEAMKHAAATCNKVLPICLLVWLLFCVLLLWWWAVESCVMAQHVVKWNPSSSTKKFVNFISDKVHCSFEGRRS